MWHDEVHVLTTEDVENIKALIDHCRAMSVAQLSAAGVSIIMGPAPVAPPRRYLPVGAPPAPDEDAGEGGTSLPPAPSAPGAAPEEDPNDPLFDAVRGDKP